MRYHCIQCDEAFEVAAGDDKPRCPKCLRQHGLRKLDSVPAAAAAGSRVPLLLVAALVLGAVGGGLWWRHKAARSTGPIGQAPVDAEELQERARRGAGLEAGDLAQLLVADDQVAGFATRATQGKGSAAQKAQAVVLALAERSKKQGFVSWSRTDPRVGAPMTARQVLAAISKDGARVQLYPLEAAALAVAALRSVDVPASIAEVFRYEGETTALDPSGRLGYYAVALLPPAVSTTQLFDAYGARPAQPSAGAFTVLNDLQALGALLSLRAMDRLSNGADPHGALADADAAVKLLPSSPSTRSVRGAVLLASGGAEEGSREMEAALQLRSDAARRNNVAMVALARGDGARATKEVSLALAEAPDFASAHLTLATLHMASAERDLARAELEKCDSLDHDLPALPLAWAELYAGSGELTQALAKAQEGVRMRPKNPEAHLVLARIDRQAGRYDDMRREAQQVLALATVADTDRVKALLREMLGPTALEAPSAPEPTQAAPEPSAPTDLTLGGGAGPSKAGDNAPHLLDQPSPRPGTPGDLQLGSPAPKLHLGGSDSKLKLDLSH